MKIAITGATGFLGSNLTRRMLERGDTVRILARSEEKAAPWRDSTEVVVGDIADPATLGQLVDGVDTVFHLVSNFRVASGPPESYTRVNVDGTRVTLEAARTAGVRRFVHTSTIGVHGHVRTTPANEQSEFHPGDLYQTTKLEAERRCHEAQSEETARRAGGDTGMDIVIVRPCSIYGPGDLRMLKMFRMLAKRRFFTLGPCEENFHAVYIDDLIDGFVQAMETPDIHGEIFILGGKRYLSLWNYIETAARSVDAPSPWIRLPYAPVFLLSRACEAACVPFGIEPPLHPRRVRFFKNNRAFSIDRAQRRLGYDPQVDLEEGMRRTVAWYREHGHL